MVKFFYKPNNNYLGINNLHKINYYSDLQLKKSTS